MVWYMPGDFGDSLYLTTSIRKISAEVVASGEAKIFPPKSVLIVSIGGTLGKIGFAIEASSANQQINAVIPNKKIDGYFLAYSLNDAKVQTRQSGSLGHWAGLHEHELRLRPGG